MSGKLNSLESDVKRTKNNQTEMESELEKLSVSNSDLLKITSEDKIQIDNLSKCMSKVMEEDQKVSNALSEIREQTVQLQNTMIDLQCRSMKYNLIFNGLKEYNDENTEEMLRDFLYRELQIEHKIEFGNIHRFGKFKENRSRPIVAKFLYYGDLDLVKSRANMLRGKPYGINEQFPPIVEQERKKLYPVMKNLRVSGQKVKLVRDKLFVNNQLYDITKHNTTHFDRRPSIRHDNEPVRNPSQATFTNNPIRPWETNDRNTSTGTSSSGRPSAKRHAHFSSSSKTSPLRHRKSRGVHGLSILAWNVGKGLRKKLTEQAFINIVCQHDILCLFEAWISEDDVIELTDYTVYKYARDKGRGGGTVIFIKNKIISACKIHMNILDCIVFINVSSPSPVDKPLAIFACYFPPYNSVFYERNDINLFYCREEEISKVSKSHTIITIITLNSRTSIEYDFVAFDKLNETADALLSNI